MRRFAPAVLLLVPLSARAAAPLRLVLIEDEPTRTTLQLAQPIERVLRAAGAELLDAESVSCLVSGADHRFRLPPGYPAPDLSASAAASALEADAETLLIFPELPDLAEALRAAAADPATWRHPNSLTLRLRDAEATLARAAGGETLVSARVDLQRRISRRAHADLAAWYRVRWKGREAAIAVVGRSYGGLGRLAALAAREAERGPFTGLSRGGAFGGAGSDARGRVVLDALETAGLRYAAVSGSELSSWNELLAYRREKSDGVRFLSANLVFSSAPATAALPPYAVFAASGARVAILGLTPEWANRLLPASAGLKVVDPVLAAEALIPRLRAEADVVIALSALSEADQARLSTRARGLDLIFADDAPFLASAPPPASALEQKDRPAYDNPFPPLRAYSPALNVIEVTRREEDGVADWRVAQLALLLDDLVPPAEGFPEPSFEAYAARSSSEPALLPDARIAFPQERRAVFPVYESRDFWTLAGALLAERGRAEAAVLQPRLLQPQTVGEIREPYLRDWLGAAEPALTVDLSGAELRALAERARDQGARERAGLPVSGTRVTVSGVDADGRVRGAPLDPNARYRVATTRSSADALKLPEPREPLPGLPDAGEAVLDELRARWEKAAPADYGAWMSGRPVSEPGLWRVNVRDLSLNLRQTKVVRSDAFDPVPNSRVQGFDELLVGGTLKSDLDYLKKNYKWTNTLEMEYARSRIRPRSAPATVNLAANRIMFLTLGTRRTGGIPYSWFARSWGPSLGAQFDGEFQSAPGLRRKQVYSLFPGVEFFDGSFVRTLTVSGSVKRDLSRDPPNTQTGARLRTVFSGELGRSKSTLQGELWSTYYFLAKRDLPTDLRVEGDFNMKLRVPIRKHLWIAPFADFYWFQLKTRPDWGYSFMTGISIGFSRLWKPQYEDF